MLSQARQLHWSIYVLSLANGVIMTGFMMMVPLLPRYAEQLHFDGFVIGLLVGSFFLGRVSSQFPLGVLSDRVGRKLVMSSSLLLFALATTAFALTTEAAPMVLLRFLQGVSSAGFIVGFQSYVNDRTPSRLRGLAHGINSSAINIGVVVGPLLGGILYQAYSLKAPFWAGGALGGGCFLLSLLIPAIPRRKAVAAGASLLERAKRLLSVVITPPAMSLAGIHFLQMMSLAVFLAAAPIVTAEALGWDATDIAVAFGVSGIAAAAASPFLGRLSDRRGSRILVMAAGLVFMALEALTIYLHPGRTAVMAGFIIGGTGAPAYFNSFFSLVGDITTMGERGAVSGFIGSLAEWGSIAGGSLLAPLLWRYSGTDAPLGLSFLVLAATVLLSLSLSRVIRRGSVRYRAGG